MRPIERLLEFMSFKGMSPYTFERHCGLANGYLAKQSRGKGTIGSAIISKIEKQFPDLSLKWLLSGAGEMLERKNSSGSSEVHEQERHYQAGGEEIVRLLREKVAVLEASLADKNKIIQLLESKIDNTSGQ